MSLGPILVSGGGGLPLGAYWEVVLTTGSVGSDDMHGITWGNPDATTPFRTDPTVMCVRQNGAVVEAGAESGLVVGAWGNGDRVGFLVVDRAVFFQINGTWQNSAAAVAVLPADQSTFNPAITSASGQVWNFYFTSGLSHLPTGYGEAFDAVSFSTIDDQGGSVSGFQINGKISAKTSAALPMIAVS